jgi:hypothetical protein
MSSILFQHASGFAMIEWVKQINLPFFELKKYAFTFKSENKI